MYVSFREETNPDENTANAALLHYYMYELSIFNNE